MSSIKRFAKNTQGKDYFVGDLHGMYDMLMEKLDALGFDKTKDRLFSVGDLGDRGPKSFECVLLIEESWFHAVRGNHEDMAIGVERSQWPVANFISNGGHWLFELDMVERRYAISLMENLPYIIEVELENGMIGVLHADAIVSSWNEYHDNKDYLHTDQNIIWGRTRWSRKNRMIVKDVNAVVVGHTVTNRVEVYGNVVYIDTGAVFSGQEKHLTLTVLSAEQILELVK